MPRGETELSSVTPDFNLLRQAGVCAVASEFPMTGDGLAQVSTTEGVHMYALSGAPGINPDRDPVWHPLVLGMKPVTTTKCIDAGQSGSLEIRVTQSWAPGWQARVDDVPVQIRSIEEGAMFAISLPTAGCHSLSLAYRPSADLAGLAISASAVLGLAGAWLVSWRRQANA
jgi:hypothetical protein